MLLFLPLLLAGIALIAVGAAVDGMLYLMSIGVLLLVVDLLYLATRLHLALHPAPGPLTGSRRQRTSEYRLPCSTPRLRCGGSFG
ncbi:hypothetical protein ACIP2Y_19445 [Streptomyces sviceus]|uniref:hypothetical protein n=1 Tax=Streptomyces sviceus TaxID=285530 RepID=UPI0037F53DDF